MPRELNKIRVHEFEITVSSAVEDDPCGEFKRILDKLYEEFASAYEGTSSENNEGDYWELVKARDTNGNTVAEIRFDIDYVQED